MLEGDKIEVALVTEMAGVAMTNLLYFEVTDAIQPPSLDILILEIATSFNNALGGLRSSAAVLTCGTWNNLNGNDPFGQAFFNLPGIGPANALPSQTCVRVSRYAVIGALLKIGGICLAGVVESSVRRGRLANAGEFGNIETWLVTPLVTSSGPTLEPGFFYDTGPLVAPPKFVLTQKATTRARVTTLNRRRSRLCGA